MKYFWIKLFVGGFSMLSFLTSLDAQSSNCGITLEVDPDTTICSYPSTFIAEAELAGIYDFFEWSPSGLFAAPKNPTSELTVNGPITVVATAYIIDSSVNYVTNGGFAAGNSGFSSEYVYQSPTVPLPQGGYTIGDNPTNSNGGFQNCDDITGEGLMMIADGAIIQNVNVWCQAFTLDANTNYHFSFHSTSVFSTSPSTFTIFVNGNPVGDEVSNTATPCEWLSHEFVFNTENSTSIEICILCTNIEPFGNDFAIDNIRLYSLCEVTDSFDITEADEVILERDTILCEGEPFNFFGQNINASGSYAHTYSGLNGCDTTINLTATVIPDETILFYDYNELTCAHPLITLEASPPSQASTNLDYFWSTSGGNIIGSPPWNGDSIQIDAQGLYQLLIEVSENDKTCSFTREVYFFSEQSRLEYEVLPLDSIGCGQTSLDIILNPSDSNYLLTWESVSGNIVDSSDWSITVDQAGIYALQLLDPATGCTADTTLEVFGSSEIPSLFFTESGVSCIQDTGTLWVQGEVDKIDSFYWSEVSGRIYQQDSFFIQGSMGTYELIYSFGNGNCQDTFLMEITADTLPPSFLVDYTEELNCARPVGFISTRQDSGIQLQWTFQSQMLDSLQLQTIENGGQYIVEAIKLSNGCRRLDTFEIKENFLLPEVEVSGLPLLTCVRDSVVFTARSSDSIQHLWLNQQGDSLDYDHVFETSAVGTFTLVVMQPSSACKDSVELVVRLDTISPEKILPEEIYITCRDSFPFDFVLPDSVTSLEIILSGTTDWLILVDTIRFEDSGRFQLTLRDTFNKCETVDETTVINRTQRPQIAVTGIDTLGCNDSILVFIETFEDVDLSWQFGNLTDTSSRIQITQAGILRIQATDRVTSCVLDTQITIVGDQSVPTIELEGHLDSLDCSGEPISVRVLNSGSAAWLIEWLDASNQLISDSSSMNTRQAGSYTIRLTDTLTTCSNEQQFTIEADTISPPIDIDPLYELDCRQSSLTLNNPSSDVSYAVISGRDTFWIDDELNLFAAGQYTFWAQSLNNSCTSTSEFRITIDSIPPDVAFPDTLFRACIDSMNQLSLNTINYTANLKSVIDSRLDTFYLGGAPIPYSDEERMIISTWNIDNGCIATDTISLVIADLDFNWQLDVAAKCDKMKAQISIIELEDNALNTQFSLLDENSVVRFPLELSPGTYRLQLENELGCRTVKEVFIEAPTPLNLQAPSIIEAFLGELINPVVTYTPQDRNIMDWRWTSVLNIDCPTCPNPNLSADNGIVEVWAIDDQYCKDSLQIKLRIREADDVYVPNVFSPNGDGINDFFYPITGPDIQVVKQMHIYDRWGNLLFNSSEFPPQNTQGAWGGTAKGLPVSEGTYVYRLVLETRSKKIIRKTGTITLVR